MPRRKKAEHDAKLAEAAMLAAIEEEANAEILRYERQLQAAKDESLRMAWQDAPPATLAAASSKDTPAASSDQAASSGQWPQLPKPTATRAAILGGDFQVPQFFDDYLRPLRAACQDDGTSVPLASAARGSETAVELFGRARPPLQARSNAFPQGEKMFKLDQLARHRPGPLAAKFVEQVARRDGAQTPPQR